ncbi:MAG: mechanosensitive ion channel [Verrucomicrobia bacterium]|nr:mechanosensitive ion channel [Verrucomicrobiota bacterium]
MNDSLEKIWGHLRGILDYPLAKVGEYQLTLTSLLFLTVLVVLVFVAESLLRRQLIRRVLQRTYLSASLQYAIGRMTGYLFIAVGLYVALKMVGIDLGSLALVAGAIGVGIGFGLQNIINNFVSGLILLAERPIALGDRVEVDGVAGRVVQINLRSTTVVTNDNISIIVPNSSFISSKVVNWSHGDPEVRLRLPVGVAYGSDPEQVNRVLLEVAAAKSQVLKAPEPTVYFDSFGDSALNFELAVWTSEMLSSPRRFRSDLNFAIEKALRENGIKIPFPQRDLHLRSGALVVSTEHGETKVRVTEESDASRPEQA